MIPNCKISVCVACTPIKGIHMQLFCLFVNCQSHLSPCNYHFVSVCVCRDNNSHSRLCYITPRVVSLKYSSFCMIFMKYRRTILSSNFESFVEKKELLWKEKDLLWEEKHFLGRKKIHFTNILKVFC